MIVYRFEKRGIGPYVSRDAIGILRRSNKTRTHRIYISKRDQLWKQVHNKEYSSNWDKAHNSKKYMFGCASKQHLRAYFGGEFKTLFKSGYRIKRYKVPDEEVLDMGLEVAFPVRYHKLQTVQKVKEKSGFF